MTLARTPLDTLHRELGARMVPFAGYDMPVQYDRGIIREHLHTRAAAGLFDVSHMGQLTLEGAGSTALLESLLPADLVSLRRDHATYTLLTNETGGVRDDLIVTRRDDERFSLVVNAACKEQDVAHLRAHLSGQTLTWHTDRALLALQGPGASGVIAALCPAAARLPFMQGCAAVLDDAEVYISRSGYTGEDGFEISVPACAAAALARRLLGFDAVAPVGLGARDSLRLEAGLCLYGHELGPDIDPVTAGLAWTVPAARREGGARPGGFPGAAIILPRLPDRTARRRVGLRGDGKRPMRDGQPVFDGNHREVGAVSSAAYGASVGGPIAMAFVERDVSAPGSTLQVAVRGRTIAATVTSLPFVPQRYFRG